VTGAAGGIGGATATALADAGYSLLLVDIDASALRDLDVARRPGVSVIEADVTDEDAVGRVAATAMSTSGRIDALVNVVGRGLGGRKITTLSAGDWHAVLAVTLTSVFLMCRAVIPHMEAAGGGAIVNVSSVAGTRGMQASPAYCAAKGGVVALTKALAIDHGGAGVRVNCVAPGAVATPLLRSRYSAEQITRLGRSSITARVAEPAEIAGAIRWLLGQDATYIMGQIIEVDGGLATFA
jgi:NAD(P)-dependent dehydrogenase (short-subunit alcohol dehydrogenase family)